VARCREEHMSPNSEQLLSKQQASGKDPEADRFAKIGKQLLLESRRRQSVNPGELPELMKSLLLSSVQMGSLSPLILLVSMAKQSSSQLLFNPGGSNEIVVHN